MNTNITEETTLPVGYPNRCTKKENVSERTITNEVLWCYRATRHLKIHILQMKENRPQEKKSSHHLFLYFFCENKNYHPH